MAQVTKLRFSQLANAKRDPYRLDLQASIRTIKPHLRIIDTPWKRFELDSWIQAEKCIPLKGWLIEMTYESPRFFESYNFESPDTILRDGRYLEEGDSERGIEPMFEKANKVLSSITCKPSTTSSQG